MRKPTKFNLVIALLAIFIVPHLCAQDYMRINLNDGNVIEINIADIQKLTFDNLALLTPQNQIVVKQLLNLKLYPNPAKNFVNVKYTLVSEGEVLFEIYSLNGILLKSIDKGNQNVDEYDFRWNTSDFPSGVYNCVIRQNHKIISEKLIVNN